jgi:hypothetical protein
MVTPPWITGTKKSQLDRAELIVLGFMVDFYLDTIS